MRVFFLVISDWQTPKAHNSKVTLMTRELFNKYRLPTCQQSHCVHKCSMFAAKIPFKRFQMIKVSVVQVIEHETYDGQLALIDISP